MRWRSSLFGQNIISEEILFKAVTTRIKIADNVDFPKLKRQLTDLQNNKNVKLQNKYFEFL